jgi:hypothetical protein
VTLTGKGYYIWIVKQCENGDPNAIAALAREANLSHVLIKIADGAFPYNIDLDNGFDYARPAIKKLQAQNIQVWGWHYVYGNYPDQEAEIAVTRALELGVDGFVVDAELEYQDTSKAPAASRYMNILRSNLGSMPIALSSYRYPAYHIEIPWTNFLDRCDYNMPQVYWEQSHNKAGEQLQRCVNEFKNVRPYRPIIPTGPTYKQGGWIPYEEEIIEFMQVAKKLGLPAVNFWYWDGCRRYMPAFWDLIKDYQYDTQVAEVADGSLPEKYISALNSKDPDNVTALYADNAIRIGKASAIQGKTNIREWAASLMQEYSGVEFKLLNQTREKNIHNFQWEVTANNGGILSGRDTVGVADDKISYHYSFTKSEGD